MSILLQFLASRPGEDTAELENGRARTRVRRFVPICSLVAVGLVLVGCGEPTGASNVTPVSATLNANGCSQSCSAYIRLRQVGANSWTNEPQVNVGVGPWNESVGGLSPSTQYEYQACTENSGAAQFSCVGADGTASTTEPFSTFSLEGGSVWNENQQTGDGDWQTPVAPESEIDGYASQTSVAPGDTLNLHVNAPGARYRIDIERLGWYYDAGGRQVACYPSCTTDEAGVAQPAPGTPDPSTGYLDAGWSVTDNITVPSSWTTGYYEAQLVLTSGPDAGKANPVWFVVRPAATAPPSTVLVVVPVNTYQAYNPWPTTIDSSGHVLPGPTDGKSLYGFNSSNGVPANHVSFDRPLPNQWNTPLYVDFPLVRYLESQGYDISYATDADVDSGAQSLLGHKLVAVMGHSEYWSKAMRDAYQAAQAGGVNLAFMGANDGYWQIRYDDNQRTIVAYKELAQTEDPDATTDPSQLTTQFRELNPPRPECQLEGVQYGENQDTPSGGSFPYTVVSSSLGTPWMTGSGFSAGMTVQNLVGYEWDAVQPGCAVPPLTSYFHWNGNGDPIGNPSADSVGYTASSGAQVFAGGGMQFAQGLIDDSDANSWHLQLFMRQVLDAMTGITPSSTSAVIRPHSLPVTARRPGPPIKPARAPCKAPCPA